ncbi:glycosyltransferase family 2 protein [Agarivorans sp. TSD2052]|uniref:glycosyltransferase family 2 protein n=1 Tax=Agarivorans sp. TSD2052 TaxID=2937286 RepID=UPI00200CFB59|nr:glycosyltransferase family 2 protein [Agarivorans sp. TSD2052]UPW19359.1 glycosyltransferase family 2 protein [Agarivorans sp. TSD2052]
MTELIQNISYLLHAQLALIAENHALLLYQLPVFLLLELPLAWMVLLGIIFWRHKQAPPRLRATPRVSCIVTCYSEGEAIISTIQTLCEQIYSGEIEIIPVIDGANQNASTLLAAKQAQAMMSRYKNRTLLILPKWQRGGRVSSLNAGLSLARGEIILALDGDTSFDNDMILQIVKEFEDPNVPAVGGALRVRNKSLSVATRMQALEYMISIQAGKTGMAHWNLLNNISGAFGAFRRDFLKQIGAWDTHTAEDLDLTLRIKQYFKRHPNIRLPFASKAIGHTDAPETWSQLFNQRLRWDGDLIFLFMRKHRASMSPKLTGLKTFTFNFVYGLMQNTVLPLIVVLYNVYLLLFYPLSYVMASLSLLYTFYLLLALLYFSFFLLFVSERRKQDYKMLPWLLIYPGYGLLMRFFTSAAVFNEILRRGHEETSMAPWWVLKKGKKF